MGEKKPKQVWRECEECDGEGGHWADVYEPKLGPKTKFQAEMDGIWNGVTGKLLSDMIANQVTESSLLKKLLNDE